MASSSDTIEVDDYFRRIGYTGPRAATLETLSGIHLLHPQAIPFESLDPLLKRPVGLTPAALTRKLILGGRGGWCFEHNHLLADVLATLGFRVAGLAARVLWGSADEEAPRPRSHMLLRIMDVDGRDYLADVGFGGLTPTAPLLLETQTEQATPHETFRLIERSSGDLVMQALVRGIWKSLYSFDLQPQVRPDYEVASWYLENHPQSPFTNRLMAARATADRRYALLNNNLSTHPLRGPSEQVTLETPRAIREALEETFLITLPDDPSLDSVLARLIG